MIVSMVGVSGARIIDIYWHGNVGRELLKRAKKLSRDAKAPLFAVGG
jgi:hypothetical protein